MQVQVAELSLQGLTPEALNVLRRHNLLKSLVRAEIIETCMAGVKIRSEDCNQVWESYLTNNQIDDEAALEQHLARIGLDKDSLKWQLELPLKINKYCLQEYNTSQRRGFF